MRPAVEAALAVARQGLTADPPVRPPPALRRYLGFSKLSAPALKAIARVVDTDDTFRVRVADEIDEARVGRAGVLWLTRPDGWADELAGLEAESAAAAAEQADTRDERDARRRLASARAAAERATAAAQVRAAKLDEMRAELAAERARRTAAETRIAELEADLAEREEARGASSRRLAEVEARVAELLAQQKADRRRAAEPPPPPATDVVAAEDLRHIRKAVHSALHRAEELARALRELESSALADLDDHDEAVSTTSPESPLDAAVERRRALPLPPGLRDDSVDAVDHLLRTPGMLLLVDGYNVSMVGWPEVPVHEQRKRLLAALDEKALRTGAPIEVVFDGAEVDTIGVRRQGRQLLRVRFSPPGVEADDVLLDLVEQLPPRRPVTVASSDKRVRAGARAHGANLLHARQLVAALRP